MKWIKIKRVSHLIDATEKWFINTKYSPYNARKLFGFNFTACE